MTLFPETSIAGNETPTSVSSRAVAGDATFFFREAERFRGEGVDEGVDASFFALRSSLDRRSRNRSISSSLALSLAESAESADSFSSRISCHTRSGTLQPPSEEVRSSVPKPGGSGKGTPNGRETREPSFWLSRVRSPAWLRLALTDPARDRERSLRSSSVARASARSLSSFSTRNASSARSASAARSSASVTRHSASSFSRADASAAARLVAAAISLATRRLSIRSSSSFFSSAARSAAAAAAEAESPVSSPLRLRSSSSLGFVSEAASDPTRDLPRDSARSAFMRPSSAFMRSISSLSEAASSDSPPRSSRPMSFAASSASGPSDAFFFAFSIFGKADPDPIGGPLALIGDALDETDGETTSLSRGGEEGAMAVSKTRKPAADSASLRRSHAKARSKRAVCASSSTASVCWYRSSFSFSSISFSRCALAKWLESSACFASRRWTSIASMSCMSSSLSSASNEEEALFSAFSASASFASAFASFSSRSASRLSSSKRRRATSPSNIARSSLRDATEATSSSCLCAFFSFSASETSARASCSAFLSAESGGVTALFSFSPSSL
mmetsp:Transcript_15356/g.64760  ORF Transcript_15356/g.64760 Transcript_15356/m.64760 type:complete len:563 (-) Transcript_15356:271-1959(-)